MRLRVSSHGMTRLLRDNTFPRALLALLLHLPRAASFEKHYDVCEDIDDYFRPDQQILACYASSYVRAALERNATLDARELASFLVGNDVGGVRIGPAHKAAYLALHLDGARLADSIGELLAPFLRRRHAHAEEDKVILGLFLGLFHDQSGYNGGVSRPIAAVRGSPDVQAAGVHVRWWVLLLVAAPFAVVAAMKGSQFVAQTRDHGRYEHRRMKRRDKQLDDPDSGDEEYD